MYVLLAVSSLHLPACAAWQQQWCLFGGLQSGVMHTQERMVLVTL